ncbi:MAG: ScpA family protein [Patescibacteria group bacterium]
MSFEAKLDAFSGPLQILLELIENKELEITNVSLAKVTDDYLVYLEKQDVPSEELADFLTIAARLILIKSHALLPEIKLEEDADALASQLKLYKEFVTAAEHLERIYGEGRISFARGRTPAVTEEIIFAPPSNVSIQSLQIAFLYLMKRLEPFFALRQVSMQKVVSVQERIKHIHEALKARAMMTFRDITAGAQSKLDVVVSFLALLELTKQRLVKVVQGVAFGEIELKRVD